MYLETAVWELEDLWDPAEHRQSLDKTRISRHHGNDYPIQKG